MTGPDLHRTIPASVMAELLFHRGLQSSDVRSNVRCAERIAETLIQLQYRLLQAPDDYDAVRTALDRLWRGESPVEVAA